MVSTRHHPGAYPPPEAAVDGATAASPAPSSTKAPASTSKPRSVRAKSRPRVSTAKAAAGGSASAKSPSSPRAGSPSSPTSPSTGAVVRTRSRRSAAGAWSHTPSHLTLFWLLVSLPLVAWDTGYVLLRPYTMPGGWLHKPFYTPYALYGRVDYIYGLPALETRNGFTSAQGSLNIVESVLYAVYLALVWRHGREQHDVKTTRSSGGSSGSSSGGRSSRKSIDGRGAPSKKSVGWLGEARVVAGSPAGAAVLVGFAASVMTVSKTVLYWLNEYFSDFKNIGHNSLVDLIFLWIIPNGAWLVLPTYMAYVFGAEILEGLSVAAGVPMPRAIATKEEQEVTTERKGR